MGSFHLHIFVIFTGGEGGIRTHVPLLSEKRFSRPSRSTTLAPLLPQDILLVKQICNSSFSRKLTSGRSYGALFCVLIPFLQTGRPSGATFVHLRQFWRKKFCNKCLHSSARTFGITFRRWLNRGSCTRFITEVHAPAFLSTVP